MRAKHKPSNHKSKSGSLCMAPLTFSKALIWGFCFQFRENWAKMKLNKSRRQERQPGSKWSMQIYILIYARLSRELLTTLGSVQRKRPFWQFWFCAEKENFWQQWILCRGRELSDNCGFCAEEKNCLTTVGSVQRVLTFCVYHIPPGEDWNYNVQDKEDTALRICLQVVPGRYRDGTGSHVHHNKHKTKQLVS